MMSTDFRPRTPIPMADLEQRRIYHEIGLGEFEEIKRLGGPEPQHAACWRKGQEWKSVFLLNTVDGCLPSDLATGTRWSRTRRERKSVSSARSRLRGRSRRSPGNCALR